MQSPSVHTPNSKGPLGMLGMRARSEGVSALSRGEDQDAPACFSGESNDSHVERVTSHVSAGPAAQAADCTAQLPCGPWLHVCLLYGHKT